ncbi:PhoH family protein [Hazenella coriacea]|uniref:Putative ribonuclease YlaK n=1 Tax=Hazenella coriacea TaxID=1179467 RepID=A0A4R3LC95_9BACL|nr:PhoH family protein [Hazenella coriacea]TCS96890.1 putative ribonuclease YlaK [Hazenella coriacea]
MKYVVDTNLLLHSPDVLSQYNLVITAMVLRELEKHKNSHNHDLAYKARRATRYIRKHESVIEFDYKDYQVTFSEQFDPNYVDNQIIQCCLDNHYGLLTNDLLLRLKAKSLTIDVKSIENQPDDLYTGYREIMMGKEEMAYLYENLDKNSYELHPNQYLLIQDESGKTVDIKRWSGEKLVDLKQPPKKILNPFNDLQRCAIDLLYNKNIPIKVIAGTYGSGKTMLSVKMGLWHMYDKGNYAKMMVVRNPVGSGEEVGYLPGDKMDKIYDFFKPVIQHLDGGEFQAHQMIQREDLIAEIPYYMKGLTLDHGYYVLVDEAEDLDLKTLKLIGTRVGKDSCIIFSGDYKQAEGKYIRNNGLLRMIDALQGHPLVGIVVLNDDVRSEASKVFAELE